MRTSEWRGIKDLRGRRVAEAQNTQKIWEIKIQLRGETEYDGLQKKKEGDVDRVWALSF